MEQPAVLATREALYKALAELEEDIRSSDDIPYDSRLIRSLKAYMRVLWSCTHCLESDLTIDEFRMAATSFVYGWIRARRR